MKIARGRSACYSNHYDYYFAWERKRKGKGEEEWREEILVTSIQNENERVKNEVGKA